MGPVRPLPRPSAPPSADPGAELVALMRRAASGDPLATRHYLDAVWPTLGRVVRGVLGAANADVDDVLQQCLIAVSQAVGAFRGECHPVGYASRIALHVALRARRNAKVRRTRHEAIADECPEDAHVVWPADAVARERRNRALRDLLAELPEEQAEALALRAVLGWSLDEVSQATGAPMNTVRSRVRLAKEALRRRIEADPRLAEDLELST